MSQLNLVDQYGRPLEGDGPQFGPERPVYGPARFEHQPAWVRSRGRKQKAGNKRARSLLQALADAGKATVDDLAALAGFKKKSSRKGKRKSSSSSRGKRSARRARSRSSSRRAYATGSRSARRSARRYQSRLRSKMSGFHSLLGRSSLGKRSAARLRRRLARCGDNARLGSRSSISRKHARALRRELRRCQGRKIRASSRYAGLSTRGARRSSRRSGKRGLSRRGASRRLARSGGGSLSYARLMKRLRGTKMKAWVCVGPKRTGCGGGKKGKRGARVWGVLRP